MTKLAGFATRKTMRAAGWVEDHELRALDVRFQRIQPVEICLPEDGVQCQCRSGVLIESSAQVAGKESLQDLRSLLFARSNGENVMLVGNSQGEARALRSALRGAPRQTGQCHQEQQRRRPLEVEVVELRRPHVMAADGFPAPE